jgi:hypothetical protein
MKTSRASSSTLSEQFIVSGTRPWPLIHRIASANLAITTSTQLMKTESPESLREGNTLAAVRLQTWRCSNSRERKPGHTEEQWVLRASENKNTYRSLREQYGEYI